jgi:hypothetical protein
MQRLFVTVPTPVKGTRLHERQRLADQIPLGRSFTAKLYWIARFDFLRDVTPFDVRCMLSIVVLSTAWKLLSFDFSALKDLCSRPLFSFSPAVLYYPFAGMQCSLFSAISPTALQVITAFSLICFAVRPSRLLLIPAIVGLWLIDTSATLYRWNTYDLDTPLAILILIAVLPVSLREAAGVSHGPAAAARMVAMTALAYVSTYYVLAGISKLMFAWNWPFVVGVGNYYPTNYLWYGQDLPGIVDAAAGFVSSNYQRYRYLDVASAFIVLLEQFIWLLAPASLFFRIHAAVFTTAYHFVVAMTTGIVFFTWLFIPLAVTLPFSRLVKGRADVMNPQPLSARQKVILAGAAALSILAGVLPVVTGTIIPPFFNYAQFGWRYSAVDEWGDLYQLGFQNPKTGGLDVVPLNQAGFLELRQVTSLGVYAKMALTSQDASVRTVAGKGIRTMLMATRPHGANAWLLGPLAAPAHLLDSDRGIDVSKVETFYLMKGKHYQFEGRPARVNWTVCGQVQARGPDGADALNIYDECRAH